MRDQHLYEYEWRERLHWRLTGQWSERVVEQRLGRPPTDYYPAVGVAERVFGICAGGLIGVIGFLIIHAVIL